MPNRGCQVDNANFTRHIEDAEFTHQIEEACQIEDAKARMPTSQDKTVLAIHWKSKPAKQSMSMTLMRTKSNQLLLV